MHKTTGLLLPLAIGLASFPACSTTEQRAEASQSAAPIEIRTTAVPAAAPASEVTTAAATPPAKVDTRNPVTLVDRYTVMPGDTLGGIAARQDVYNDARLWPLLYRANVSQIGPGGLIFPNQVLTVDRKYSQEDVRAITSRPKTENAALAAVAEKPAVEPLPVTTAAATSTAAASTPATAPAEQAAKDTPATPEKPEAPPTAQSAQGKPAASRAASPPAGQAPQGPPAAVSAKASDYLSGARAAFAARDTQWAVYYYSVYLDQKNTDASAWGELGNVHYLDGNFPEASKAYFNAANLLIDRGQTARAMELIPAIEEGDPSLSDAILLRLTTLKR